VGVTVTATIEFPLYCVFTMILSTLTSIIIVGTQEPFADQEMRSMELFSEWKALVINYYLLCSTNFVSGPTRVSWVSYDCVCLILAVNLGYADLLMVWSVLWRLRPKLNCHGGTS
jgi:hypothetical protein